MYVSISIASFIDSSNYDMSQSTCSIPSNLFVKVIAVDVDEKKHYKKVTFVQTISANKYYRDTKRYTMSTSEPEYEDMEVLQLSLEEENLGEDLAVQHSASLNGEEVCDSEWPIELIIEARAREFKGQKKDQQLGDLLIQAATKMDFEQQIWQAYHSSLRREILCYRAEEGQEETILWGPNKPCWDDRDKFFLVCYKRSSIRLSDITNEFLHESRGSRLKLLVLVYSTSIVTAKDFERARMVLGIGTRGSGMRDRSGADSNQTLQKLVGELKQRNRNQFVKPLDASFTIWANYIQGSAAHLRDELLSGPPPEHLKHLFVEVDNETAHSVLENSLEGASVAEIVNENVEVELKEIEEAFYKVEASVSELRLKINQLKVSVSGRKNLISAFKNSLSVRDNEESRQIAQRITDFPDMDHE